jgi:hypothetical protein
MYHSMTVAVVGSGPAWQVWRVPISSIRWVTRLPSTNVSDRIGELAHVQYPNERIRKKGDTVDHRVNLLREKSMVVTNADIRQNVDDVSFVPTTPFPLCMGSTSLVTTTRT